MTEICSPFTARFPEVKKIEREYLKANWVRNVSPVVQENTVTERFSHCVQANVRNTKSFGKLICKVFGDEPEGVGEMWLDFFREL